MRCPKCGNPWSLNGDQFGNVWCQKDPPYHMGCGKKIRLKRTHTAQKKQNTSELELALEKIGVGDIYLDCAYHPVVCEEANGDDITGVSMVDGSRPRSCSIKYCAPAKMTKEGAAIVVAVWEAEGQRGAMKWLGWSEQQVNKFMKEWRSE